MINRLATASDKEQLSSLLDELIEETLLQGAAPTKTPLNQQVRGKMFLELLKRDDVKLFVIEDEGNVVAFADVFIVPIMRRSVYHALLEDFVVTKTMRGKGIGTKLMHAIMEYCKEQEIKVIK